MVEWVTSSVVPCYGQTMSTLIFALLTFCLPKIMLLLLLFIKNNIAIARRRLCVDVDTFCS